MIVVREVPTFPKARYREQVELQGTTYNLIWTWRQRSLGWYLDVLTLSGEPVALGRRVRPYADAFSSTLDVEGSLFGVGADYIMSPSDEFSAYYVTDE